MSGPALPVVQHADLDSDMLVSEDEWQRWVSETIQHINTIEASWYQIDENRDGVVTLEEYLKAHKTELEDGGDEKTFHEICAGKPHISKKAYTDYYSTDEFTSADKNHDGYWTTLTRPVSHFD